MQSSIGVDMGGTRIKAGSVVDGKITVSVVHDTPNQAGPDAVLDAVVTCVRELDPAPKSVGFAIPGEVDDQGVCYRLCNVHGFEGVNIAKSLEQKIGCPVFCENDATAAALGELKYGAGRRLSDFLLLTLGTGIGGGLALGGAVRRGRYGFAGEFGHILIDRSADAPRCACGRTGCVEAFAGTAGLRRAAAKAGLHEEDVKTLSDLAVAGDRRALGAFEGAGKALGEAIACAQNLLDMEAVIFSGGISKSFSILEKAIRQGLQSRAYAPPLAEVPFLVSEMGDKAGIVGAALLQQAAPPPGKAPMSPRFAG